MNIIASVAVCFIPLIAIFVCLAMMIKNFKVPYGLLSCLLGLLSIIPIAAVQLFIDKSGVLKVTTLTSVLLEAIVLNGIVEECIKMGLLFFLPATKTNLKTFFCYCLLCGLAVGCFETLIYLISGYENISLRMLTAVVIHVTCTGLSGLFVYSVRNKMAHVKPLICAILFHGIYNYFAGFSSSIKWFAIAVIFIAIIECRICYKTLSDISTKQ